jgi:HEAT repeat protein
MHAPSAKTLAASCSDPAARKALFDALAAHKTEGARVAVANALAACGDVAIDPLIRALEHDASIEVRSSAATSLGAIGNAKARPALEKAANDKEFGVQYAAKAALAKLKK